MNVFVYAFTHAWRAHVSTKLTSHGLTFVEIRRAEKSFPTVLQKILGFSPTWTTSSIGFQLGGLELDGFTIFDREYGTL